MTVILGVVGIPVRVRDFRRLLEVYAGFENYQKQHSFSGIQ